jgi:SSS family transporter
MTFLQLAVGYLVGKLLVSVILIPNYFKGNVQTAYEVLGQRFGPQVRNLSALVFQVSRSLADGVRLFATALVLSVVTDLPDIGTVMIIGFVTVAYTFYGGMKAVAWNDAVQLIVYVGGALLAFGFILGRIPGGWNEVILQAAPEGKLQFMDLSLDLSEPYTLLAGLVGGAFLTFATHGTDQMMVQRYLACGSVRRSQIALVISGFVVIVQFLLFLLIGVMLYAFYQHHPMDGELEQINRVFPIFIVEQLPSGVSGFIIAAIFAAAMSTLSSSLNSLSSSSLNDIYRVYLVPVASDRHYLKASRILTLFWGVVLVLLSLLARNWGEVLQAGLTITSLTMGSILGIFLFAHLSAEKRQTVGLTAMLIGLAVTLLVSQITDIAWPWFVSIGAISTLMTGVTLSKFSRS